MFESRFNFKGTELRVHIGHDSKEIFHGADTCKALGKERNHSRLIRTYVFPEYIVEVPNPNGGSPVLCLYEPGVYQLALNPIFDSEKARMFQRWIFEDVLPKLRASGGYIMPSATSDQVAALVKERDDWKDVADKLNGRMSYLSTTYAHRSKGFVLDVWIASFQKDWDTSFSSSEIASMKKRVKAVANKYNYQPDGGWYPEFIICEALPEFYLQPSGGNDYPR